MKPLPNTPKESADRFPPLEPSKQRAADVMKILPNTPKESTDRFPPLEPALGGVTALIERYEQFEDVKDKIKDLKPQLDRFKQNITTSPVNGGSEETGRCRELTRALEEIEKQSRELLAKGTMTQFADKKGDSGEVARLVERLQEAITHYQISQQRAIYNQIANLTSSLDILLKLHEKSPVVKNKLDSVMARLDWLCSEEDNDDGHWGENDYEHRVKLFGTLRLIEDNGNVLCNRIDTQGYNECQDDIQAASSMADDIRDAVIDYQVAMQRAIYNKSSRLIDAADLSVLNSCRRARGAGYRHGDRKGCLRGTRETVLNEIESWARDFKKSPVFWLNGLAGTGKSTIAQTVSERVFGDGLLGASFFCSRDFEDRSDLHFILPTLAFQLAHKYPTFRSVLVPLLRLNPDIVHESLMNQMEALIVEPLKSADVWMVIVIDALDECKDEEPSSAILSVLGRFVEQMPKVKFFITGRPEPRIKTGFRLPLLVDSTDVFVLHDVHPSLINSDIRLFLKHELSEVARRHQLEGWPSDEHVDLLCRRAGGLFVYAVATVKFLDSRIHLPKQRLEVIVNLPECTVHEGKTRFNSRSKTTLDLLYTSILETAFSEGDVEVDSKVRSTIGTVVLLVNPLPPSGIAELIGLDPQEVTQFLTLLQSLLTFDEDSSKPVKPFHKSFPDFITDPSRCTDTRFLVSSKSLHLKLAVDCLRVMNDRLEKNLLSLPDYALNSEVRDLEARISDRISNALRYACRSWHSHLTKAGGDVAGVIPLLRVLLEEKFLVWLEVVSVLGAVGGAIVALEQLIAWLHEVSGNEELLDTARDYSHFVATFFEPISVSATHIYQSALELSPSSSIVRRWYYCQRYSSLPRVVGGIEESWEEGIIIPSKNHHLSCAWSPCGRFIAAQSRKAVEIRDSLGLELISTLKFTKPTSDEFTSLLAYSTDGRSIAFLSGTSLVIWDIQTGGIAKEIDYGGARNASLAWSLDGSTIGIVRNRDWRTYFVRTCDVASGAIHAFGTLESETPPHLWACGTSFRVMTTRWLDETCTINIFKVGSIITKIESFDTRAERYTIGSFSQTTHRIAILSSSSVAVLDIRDWRYLLREYGNSSLSPHCFSSDGCLFAALHWRDIQIWKYTSDRYIRWRKFSNLDSTRSLGFLRFSPTSSSLLGYLNGILGMWRLDGLPINTRPDSCRQLIVPPPHGGYIVACHRGDSTVTVANFLPQTPPCIIDTGMAIETLTLTSNILLVLGSSTIAAWRLTEEGVVDGVFAGEMTGRDSRIWTVSVSNRPGLYVGDQTAAIEQGGNVIHAYHKETGEVLKRVRKLLRPFPRLWGTPLNAMGRLHEHRWAHQMDALDYLDYLCEHEWRTPSEGDGLVSQKILQGGWVKDSEGKHLLWLPVEWRNCWHIAHWSRSGTVVWLSLDEARRDIIIKF